MKKGLSILLFALFCVFTFTFKTHYCYFNSAHEGAHVWYDHYGNRQDCSGHKIHDRFHGDCHYLTDKEKENTDNQKLFPSYYYCIDVLKYAQYCRTKIILQQNYSTGGFIHPPVLDIPTPILSFGKWNIKDIQCRSESPPLSIFLRAPPMS